MSSLKRPQSVLDELTVFYTPFTDISDPDSIGSHVLQRLRQGFPVALSAAFLRSLLSSTEDSSKSILASLKNLEDVYIFAAPDRPYSAEFYSDNLAKLSVESTKMCFAELEIPLSGYLLENPAVDSTLVFETDPGFYLIESPALFNTADAEEDNLKLTVSHHRLIVVKSINSEAPVSLPPTVVDYLENFSQPILDRKVFEKAYPSNAHSRYFHTRFEKLLERIHKAFESIVSGLDFKGRKTRLNSAIDSLLRVASLTTVDADISQVKEIAKGLLEAHVELDAIEHPDTAPEKGWATLTEEDSRWIVDTQLATASFGIAEFEASLSYGYKPRKREFIDFFSNSLGYREILSDELTQKNALTRRVSIKKLRAAPDIIQLRKSSEITQTITLHNDIVFRSGIGAHRANSTTGFEFGYWTDSEVASGTLVSCVWPLLLETNDVALLSLRPLTALGGVSDEAYSLTQTIRLSPETTTGGLHGGRFIDAITGLSIDFRFSKPLSSLVVEINEGSWGPICHFSFDLSKHTDVEKQMKLFVSI